MNLKREPQEIVCAIHTVRPHHSDQLTADGYGLIEFYSNSNGMEWNGQDKRPALFWPLEEPVATRTARCSPNSLKACTSAANGRNEANEETIAGTECRKCEWRVIGIGLQLCVRRAKGFQFETFGLLPTLAGAKPAEVVDRERERERFGCFSGCPVSCVLCLVSCVLCFMSYDLMSV